VGCKNQQYMVFHHHNSLELKHILLHYHKKQKSKDLEQCKSLGYGDKFRFFHHKDRWCMHFRHYIQQGSIDIQLRYIYQLCIYFCRYIYHYLGYGHSFQMLYRKNQQYMQFHHHNSFQNRDLLAVEEVEEHILLDMLLLLVFCKQLLHKFHLFHKLDKKLQHNHKKELVLVLVLHIFDYKLLFVGFCKQLQ
jgi:hypothetical protein